MSDPLHVVCPHCHRVNRVPREKLAAGGKCGACHGALFAGQPVELDADSMQRHIASSDIPLLVDFWAPWCAPCQMMAPGFKQAAATLEPQLRLAKLNTEIHSQAAAPYGIRGIPTLILFSGGREQARISGALNEQQLVAWIRQQL